MHLCPCSQGKTSPCGEAQFRSNSNQSCRHGRCLCRSVFAQRRLTAGPIHHSQGIPMLTSPSGIIATRTAAGLLACCFACSKQLPAQSPSRVLVVVVDASDAKCAKQIGGEHVRVEPLFSPEHDALPSNYDACDRQVRRLTEFCLLISRAETCPSQSLWRERMVRGNPRGRILSLREPRLCAATTYERRIQQAIDVHGALASVLPHRRASLDANLEAELRLLYLLLRNSSKQLALRE